MKNRSIPTENNWKDEVNLRLICAESILSDASELVVGSEGIDQYTLHGALTLVRDARLLLEAKHFPGNAELNRQRGV